MTDNKNQYIHKIDSIASFDTRPLMEGQDHQMDLNLEEYTFTNGLKLYYLETDLPLFHFRTYYRVGSVHEADGIRGIAHLFEHMMFRQFTRRDEQGKVMMQLKTGDIWNVFRELGGTGINATTWNDRTNYYVSAPAQSLEKVMEVESLRMKYLDIDQELLETEKNAVFTEFSRLLDTPSQALFYYFSQRSMKTHPYKYDTIGLLDDLKQISVADCNIFYKRFYSPQNAAILVIGKVDRDKLLNLTHKYYGHYQNEMELKFPNCPAEPLPKEEISFSVPHHVKTEKIVIGYLAPGLTEAYNHQFNQFNQLAGDEVFSARERPALSILSALIAQGSASEFEKILVDGKLASSYYYFYPYTQYPVHIFFFVDMNKGKNASQVIEIMDRLAQKYQTELVSQEDITRVQNKILLSCYQRMEKVSSLASLLGEYYIGSGGNPLYYFKFIDQLQQVTPKDVKRAAQKYLIPKQRVCGVLTKGEPLHKGMFDQVSQR